MRLFSWLVTLWYIASSLANSEISGFESKAFKHHRGVNEAKRSYVRINVIMSLEQSCQI